MLHGGGPTAVLNASLAGVVEACRAEPSITALYGAEHGAAGLLDGSLIDLYAEDPSLWEQIALTPGSVLGSTRRKVGPEDYARMLAILARLKIRYVLANGGNGTMQMADELGKAAEDAGVDLRVIGIPKTIDNDLVGTDHTPGYGSAARFFATALRDIGADNRALPGVTFVEILGRNAGWLAAACALARAQEDDAPHLIYFPERRIAFDRMLSDVEAVYRRRGRAVIAQYDCGSCHTIPGVRGADGLVAPPLFWFSRRTFIAGELPNSPDNLARWIRAPRSVEPTTAMPALGLSEQQARDAAAYLYTLR